MDDIQAFGVPVNQRERGTAQQLGAEQGGKRVLAKGGAPRADDNNFGGKSHIILLILLILNRL
jgi:hypothetical protein